MNNKIEILNMRTLDAAGALKAFCDIALFDLITVKGLKIVLGRHGLFLDMPNTKSKDGKWYKQVILTDNNFKKAVYNSAIEHYSNLLSEKSEEPE